MPVRRVRRVIRKIDPWTVLKVTLVFNAIMGLAFVLGGVIFWSIFVNAGIPDKISELAELLTLSFNPDGPTYFRIAVLLSVIWVVLSTGFATLGALLYNLISDVVGGVEVIVLEETLAPATPVVRPAAPKKARPVRTARFRRKKEPAVAAAPEPAPAPAAPPPAETPPQPATKPAPPATAPKPEQPAAATRVETPKAAPAPPAAEVEAPKAKTTPAPKPVPDSASPNGEATAKKAEPAAPAKETSVGS